MTSLQNCALKLFLTLLLSFTCSVESLFHQHQSNRSYGGRRRKASPTITAVGGTKVRSFQPYQRNCQIGGYCQHYRRGRVSSSSSALNLAAVTDALSIVNQFYIDFPYAAAGLTCGAKASAADFVAQQRSDVPAGEDNGDDKDVALTSIEVVGSEEGNKFEVQRNFAYLVYGALYQGVAQEFLYNHIYPTLFGSGVSMEEVAAKVLFDLLLQTTLLTLPVAYITKALVYGYSVQEAFRRYWHDIQHQGLLIKYFCIWGPVQCLTFSVVPEHLRVSFIAVVSFFWIIILSTIAAVGDQEEGEEDAGVATTATSVSE